MFIMYVPGVSAMTWTDEVLPLLQRNAIGAIPPEDDAVHVMLEAVGEPTQDVVSADAALALANPACRLATCGLSKD